MSPEQLVDKITTRLVNEFYEYDSWNDISDYEKDKWRENVKKVLPVVLSHIEEIVEIKWTSDVDGELVLKEPYRKMLEAQNEKG